MATAYATSGNPVESGMAGIGGMDMDMNEPRRRHLSIPVPISIEAPTDDHDSYSNSQPSPRSGPPPNPHFVFPARSLPSSAPSSFSRATGQRSRSVADSLDNNSKTGSLGPSSARTRRSVALPAFSFNPGAGQDTDGTASDRPQDSLALPEFSFNPAETSSNNDSLMSPPLSPGSPASPRTVPNRGGHKRGGSEFVGGKLKEGESITLMNASPTKPESGFASPSLAPVDSSARRGRHQHRRSAAISSHDLSMILKPPSSPNPSRGSSAPSSPADFEGKVKLFPESTEEPAKESPKAKVEDHKEVSEGMESTASSAQPSPGTKPTRAKVGFSDTLEYIPRPLSMVSTDTSSTVTGHPGHSVSGSISSIISLSNSMATDRERHEIPPSPVFGKRSCDSRPSTAGAVLERTPSLLASFPVEEPPSSPRRRNSIPLLPGITSEGPSSPALPSPTRMPKRWSFFGLEPFASSSLPQKQRPHSSSSSETATKPMEAPVALCESDLERDIETEAQSSKKSSSKKKRQKKVKSWAGSILTRKTKPRSIKAKSGRRRSQTPPPQAGLDDDMYEDEIDMSGPLTAPMVMVTQSSSMVATSPTKPRRKSEDDASFPMIDLDAALGPFNTPTGRDPAWDAAQSTGAATPKRRLHSAAGLRGFSGPGMHYHRRAESAPEMPPFEARFGIHRFGSSSTMADVFEEDEEDEDEEDSGTESPSQDSTQDTSATTGLCIESRSMSDDSAATPTQEIDFARTNSNGSIPQPPSIKRKGSGSSLDLQPPGSRVRTETSVSSLHEEIIDEEVPATFTAVDQERIYETVHESGPVAPSPRRITAGKDLAPVEIHPINLPGPMAGISPYSMSHSSSFPSPRSPMSYDAHRVSTAPSSVTEENNFQSLLMGEPGPEVVRISVDVPSLTDSTSTMTRESNFPGVRPRNMPFHDQRPASFTSTAFGRRRSSLASLSRLISTSHGERSKLSMEVPIDSEHDKKAKVSTAKRLSRMMQFWKPKESAAS
ncbi:cell wall proline rich protein [Seiridium cupressi]